ncbi:hypothetical protein XU18_0073 [Perkinsela sp. CCAP 1560/4]|nr:hypothetical protein XU18_0073 [Perkinsela sp. CCAP 1560/4]|eukprot:KNH09388.1 hypothetical protein XU18_0073 [Perkinsela sp. CCAP 1560/4]
MTADEDIDDILVGALAQYEESVKKQDAEDKRVKSMQQQQPTSGDGMGTSKGGSEESNEIGSMINEMEKLLTELKTELNCLTENDRKESAEAKTPAPETNNTTRHDEHDAVVDENANIFLQKFSDLESSLQEMLHHLPTINSEEPKENSETRKDIRSSHEELLEQISKMQKQWDLFE